MKQPLFKTLTELMQYIGEYLPDATIGEDNDGQLVIYTNLYETDEYMLATYNDED